MGPYRLIYMTVILSVIGILFSSYLALKVVRHERGTLKVLAAFVAFLLASIVLTLDPLGITAEFVPFLPSAVSLIAFLVAGIYWVIKGHLADSTKAKINKFVATFVRGPF